MKLPKFLQRQKKKGTCALSTPGRPDEPEPGARAQADSPFVNDLLEVLGLTGKYVQSLTLHIDNDGEITVNVVRYVTSDEGTRITDRLMNEVLTVKVKKGSRKERTK